MIVIEALLRVARRALRGAYDVAIAAAAFVAIFFFAAPFPLIIAAAALVGFCRHSATPAPTAATAARCRRAARRRRSRPRRCGSRSGSCRSSSWRRMFGAHPCHDRHRPVLLEACRGDLRRRLFGAGLHGAAGGRDLWLAERGRDARRARSRRDDAGPADSRHRVRGLPRRLPPWRRAGARLRPARRCRHAVGDLRAVLPLDLHRRALCRAR